jgi:hypothetical protein
MSFFPLYQKHNGLKSKVVKPHEILRRSNDLFTNGIFFLINGRCSYPGFVESL